MNVFHPASSMCLARYFNSSNKLLKEKIIFMVKSSGDIPIYQSSTNLAFNINQRHTPTTSIFQSPRHSLNLTLNPLSIPGCVYVHHKPSQHIRRYRRARSSPSPRSHSHARLSRRGRMKRVCIVSLTLATRPRVYTRARARESAARSGSRVMSATNELASPD